MKTTVDFRLFEPLEHDGATPGYDSLPFDLIRKGRVKGQAIILKVRDVVLKESPWRLIAWVYRTIHSAGLQLPP